LLGTDKLRGGCAQNLRLVLCVGLEHTLEVGGHDGELGTVVDNRVHKVSVVSDDTEECV
jgi:hypothetical protein